MKRTIANLTVFTLLGAAALCAETVKANIPFDFNVGQAVMPSGQYLVSSNGPQGIILAQAANGNKAAMSLTNSVSRHSNVDQGKLVFNVYGDRHFLSQIWAPGSDRGREVTKSKAERELTKQRHEFGLAAIRATLR